MRFMTRMTFTFLMLLVSQLAAFDHHRDAKAEELAHTVMNTMGGEKAWYGAHFVRFDFEVNDCGKMVVDRSNLWDKMSGRYRVDDKTKEGKPRVTLFNINDRHGEVY